MRGWFQLASYLAIALTGLPCVLYFAGWLGHEPTKWCMLIGTVLWFAFTPLWMGRTGDADAA